MVDLRPGHVWHARTRSRDKYCDRLQGSDKSYTPPTARASNAHSDRVRDSVEMLYGYFGGCRAWSFNHLVANVDPFTGYTFICQCYKDFP